MNFTRNSLISTGSERTSCFNYTVEGSLWMSCYIVFCYASKSSSSNFFAVTTKKNTFKQFLLHGLLDANLQPLIGTSIMHLYLSLSEGAKT